MSRYRLKMKQKAQRLFLFGKLDQKCANGDNVM